jgi:hypothetical protein
LNDLGWKVFNALFPRTLESFSRRFAGFGSLAVYSPQIHPLQTEDMIMTISNDLRLSMGMAANAMSELKEVFSNRLPVATPKGNCLRPPDLSSYPLGTTNSCMRTLRLYRWLTGKLTLSK